MSVGQGYKLYASLREEATYNVDPGGARDGYIRLISDNMTCEENVKDLPGQGGRYVRGVYEGNRIAGGTITPESNFEGGLLYLFKHCCGGYVFGVDGGGEVGAHLHTFTPADALPVGLSMEVSKGDVDPGEVFLYTGSKVDSLAMSWTAEELMGLVATMMSADETAGTTEIGSPSYPLDAPIKYNFAGTVTLLGDAVAAHRGGSMTINNALERRFNMSRITKEPLPGAKRGVEMTIETEFEDLTHYTKYKNATAGSFALAFTSSVNIPTTATPYSLTIVGSTTRLTGSTPVVTSEGVVLVTYGLKLYGSSEFSISIVNGQTTL